MTFRTYWAAKGHRGTVWTADIDILFDVIAQRFAVWHTVAIEGAIGVRVSTSSGVPVAPVYGQTVAVRLDAEISFWYKW
jgi:hypothetical protein